MSRRKLTFAKPDSEVRVVAVWNSYSSSPLNQLSNETRNQLQQRDLESPPVCQLQIFFFRLDEECSFVYGDLA